MNQSSSKHFRDAYNKYQKLYTEKQFEQSIKMLPQFGLKENYINYTEHVNYVLRSACFAMNRVKKPKYTALVATEWKNVLCAVTCQHEKFISSLKYFTTSNCWMSYLPLFSALEPKVFDLSDWLKSINTSLFNVIEKALDIKDIGNDDNNRKEIYLHLTQLLLVFVQAEAKRPTLSSCGRLDLSESRRFLENCQNLKLYKREDQKQDTNIKQYITSFKILAKLLDALSVDSAKTEKATQKFREDLKSLMGSNELRATLLQDNMLTMAKILKACETHFIKAIDSKAAIELFALIKYIMVVLRKVKSEKSFCEKCDAVANHCSHDLAMLSMDLYSKLMEGDVDNTIIQNFEFIIQFDYEAISKLKCTQALPTQNESVNKFKIMMKHCETTLKVDYIKPVAKIVLKCSQAFKLLDEVTKFDVVYIFNSLYNVLNAANDWLELINVGYLMMAFHSTIPHHPINCESIAWTIAKKQRDNKTTITPYDHFNSPDSKSKSMYGIQLPKEFDVNKMSLALLKVGFKFSVMAPELSNRIVHQWLMSMPVDDPNALRFVLSVQSMKFDKLTNERVEKIVKAMHGRSKNDPSIGLQLAAIKNLQFHYDMLQTAEKYANCHISESLTEVNLASDDNIFREITLDYEKEQMKTLHYIKKTFIDFADYYLKVEGNEYMKYEDEKDLLLRELKIIANQFVIRGYIEDGLELFVCLLYLSRATDDDFGQIDACSFFAEHSSEYKRKYPHKNLKKTIEKSTVIIMPKLKEITSLSLRKQNQICFCMLNLVLFYFGECGNHKKEIKEILTFIYNAIGSADKTMEATVDALVGSAPKTTNTIKIHSESVRIKFYSIMFTIITKFEAPSVFHPTKFIHFTMNHVKRYLKSHFDATVGIPVMLFNMLPQMICWQEQRYEQEVESKSLVMTLLKLAVKSGYALRAANLIVNLLHMDLMVEKMTMCKVQFKALEHMMISNAPDRTEYKDLKCNQLAVDNEEILCEPIRKAVGVTSPILGISPKQITSVNVTNHLIKYLPTHSMIGCDCGLCCTLENRFLVFCVAVAYARFAFLNEEEFDLDHKRAIFTELHEYWEKSREQKYFPKCDMYYLICARMFMYRSHDQWKYQKEYKRAVDSMRRGLMGLDRVKHSTVNTLKFDLNYQITTQTETIPKLKVPREEKFKGRKGFMSVCKKFDDEPSPSVDQMKKPRAPVKAASRIQAATPKAPATPNARPNLIDMVKKSEKTPAASNFQIYGDTDDVKTPCVKRSTRARAKAINDQAKTAEKPKPASKSKSPKESEKNSLELSAKMEKLTVSSSPETPVLSQAILQEPPKLHRKPKCTNARLERKTQLKGNATFQP